MSNIAHFLLDLFSFTGIRDRLRCPFCCAVGTYKPHGGLVDRIFHGDTAGVRRWLCKWCGTYWAMDGTTKTAGIDREKGCWTLEATENPQAIVTSNPWKG